MKQNLKKTTSIFLIICLVLVMFESAYAEKLIFQDSIGHWAEDAILKLTDEGVISGFPDGLCHPDEMITRAEFTALVDRKIERSQDGAVNRPSDFTDIKGHWAEKNITKLTSLDIIVEEEYPENQFSPDEPITRLEMVKMLVRALGIENHSGNCICDLDFTDAQLIKSEDKIYVCIGKKYGIISGYPDGTMQSAGVATRAEAFKMLVKEEEASEQIKREKEQNSVIKNPKEESSNGGSGGAAYVPEPQFSFILPKTAYAGEGIEIKSESQNVTTVAWVVLKNGISVEIPDVVDGELNSGGGIVKIKESGIYTFTATAKNSVGKKITCEQTVTIYPVVTVNFDMPKTAHTDTGIAVDLKSENLGQNLVVWSLIKDGMEVKLENSVIGELGNTGGAMLFSRKGSYELTATITDELGKVSTVSKNIDIYPVAEINLALQSVTHTDKTIAFHVQTKEAEDMTVKWSLMKDGEPVTIENFIEGELSLGENNIRFKEKGVYRLTATLTDKTGRVFTDTAEIIAYPVGSVGFYLPSILHTDDTVKVEATLDEIGNHTAIWSLKKDGKDVQLSEFISGDLTNDGGEVRFKGKGIYTLKASFTDDGQRDYSYEQQIKVYSVPIVSYTQPQYAHTDTEIEIIVKSTDLDGLTLEWLVDNSFGYQDWNTFVEGSLSDTGGKIKFKRAGIYELVARATDETGRVFLFEPKKTTEVLPVLTIDFNLPKVAYTDTSIDLRTSGHNNTLPVEWSLSRNGQAVSLSKVLDGALTALGGKVIFKEHGEFVLTATMTDFLGRSYTHSQEIKIMPVMDFTFTMPSDVHYGKSFPVTISNAKHTQNATVVWVLTQNGETERYTGALTEKGGNISISNTGKFVLTSVATDVLGRESRCTQEINVTNTAPTITNLTATPTRTVKDGKFLVEVSATAEDADGDKFELEWEGRASDGYYAVGTNTVKVRAKDIAGAYSNWAEKTFTVVNTAPTITNFTVTQTRNTKDGKFLVNISATAEDTDGDKFELEWDGKVADSYYAVGTNTVKVRAQDIAGACSQWEVKTFTVVNATPTITNFTVTPTRTVKDGKFLVNISATAVDADGDKFELEWEGKVADGYYAVGTHTVKVRAKDIAGACSQWAVKTFTIANSAPTIINFTLTPTRTVKDGKFLVNISATAADADGDKFELEWEGKSADGYYGVGTHTVKVRAKDIAGVYSQWAVKTFTVANSAPTITNFTVTPTRTAKDGKFLVNISASAVDADGDATVIEWQGKNSDGYYAVGTYTIKVRAKDSVGSYSPWSEKTFTVANSAPERPVITRTPNGNSVTPGTAVTITAKSSDADGDAITYVWENRPAESAVYPLGKNVVRVKAVDSAGAESPWSAIMFFVADSNGSGGMTLSGPDSIILENGIEGATITGYTFTVPPVSGHSGNDYGRVRGYNIRTNQWDQLDYETTSNGITFERSLNSGSYSKLEFYYYTNHNCMYNKSNITYTVDYYFE
ncbi:S-layer homology domain-containing protein [Anaerotignum propionicum]|uniref:S-layer homology domain-containing protein n=1 Tax=Anaerotignum propionicum TaxID=28446 RepID=UPI002108942B|nr:S-layer homology domain-containing protein [Anaerotignum propionicum]MCQ4935974.1 S-layer homology domain-containing protein [Anaerotignum propionicum]